ncbi:MAG: DUF1566 domain-containing protein [Immundisolibacter sp.]|uniref:Lcl C-terminal domain-containing protein n=1 Tax=Immundisolibacter sp. TaxID=1934948 RepID=UPI003D10F0F8
MAEGKSFWSSLPGILTALAGLVTAIGGLLLAFDQAGLFGKTEPATAPVANAAPPPLLERIGVTEVERVTLRGVPTTLNDERLTAALATRGLFDAARNPAGAGVDNRFETVLREEALVVRDATTGLSWQRDGTEGLDLAAAEAQIAALNAQAHGGYRDWRLPTAEEAASLMEKAPLDGRHIDPVFGIGVNFIWTADRTPDGRAYVAYWFDGRLSPERPTFHAWVRAVR